MKIKMNYFTSTGNTLWMVEKMKTNFFELGNEVEAYDSVTCTEECYKDCDIIGFVYPVWGSTMPNPQRDILNSLPKANGKKIFFIGNAGAFCGDTGIYYMRIAKEKGYETIYVDHVFLPINSIFPGFTFFKQPNKDKVTRMQSKAEKRLEIICTDIVNGKKKFNGQRPLQRIGGWGQRSNYDPIVDTFKEKMYIDNQKCSKCGLCYSICPKNAIEMEEDGSFSINTDKCILCLKCYNYCPKACALKEAKSADIKKYPRYKGLDKSIKPIVYRKKDVYEN